MRNLRLITSHFSRTFKPIKPNPLTQRHISSSPQSPTVSKLITELSNLTLLETMDLTEVLRQKLKVGEMPVMASMGSLASSKSSGGGGKVAEKKEKVEKTAFDLMLQGFEASAKLKVIKEVRSVTDLGLKEAKELVGNAPCCLKKGVSKEEAESIIDKLKAVGAKVSMD